MRIVERKEVTTVKVEEVIVGRKCDICNRDIEQVHPGVKNPEYNYFVIHTWHDDWGNDSVDSHERMDACCPECAMRYANGYIEEAYKEKWNTRRIEIAHVSNLKEGAYND